MHPGNDRLLPAGNPLISRADEVASFKERERRGYSLGMLIANTVLERRNKLSSLLTFRSRKKIDGREG